MRPGRRLVAASRRDSALVILCAPRISTPGPHEEGSRRAPLADRPPAISTRLRATGQKGSCWILRAARTTAVSATRCASTAHGARQRLLLRHGRMALSASRTRRPGHAEFALRLRYAGGAGSAYVALSSIAQQRAAPGGMGSGPPSEAPRACGRTCVLLRLRVESKPRDHTIVYCLRRNSACPFQRR